MKAYSDDYRLIRVWKKTHKTLKVLAAHSQESLVELLDRLAEQERTMKQFEYRLIKLQYQATNPPVLQYEEQVSGPGVIRVHDINTLGEQGWELVTFMQQPENNPTGRSNPTLVGIFKREKRSTND
jgi:hypothetical protein